MIHNICSIWLSWKQWPLNYGICLSQNIMVLCCCQCRQGNFLVHKNTMMAAIPLHWCATVTVCATVTLVCHAYHVDCSSVLLSRIGLRCATWIIQDSIFVNICLKSTLKARQLCVCAALGGDFLLWNLRQYRYMEPRCTLGLCAYHSRCPPYNDSDRQWWWLKKQFWQCWHQPFMIYKQLDKQTCRQGV